jgi:prolyl-tRNA editing enzyme YbaK/EbsC (Cys-tRNA(Pro) deacylase)
MRRGTDDPSLSGRGLRLRPWLRSLRIVPTAQFERTTTCPALTQLARRSVAEVRTGRIRRASPEFVLQHTGQAVGGVAPVGHPEKIRTLLDEALQKHALLWAGAGDHNAMFSITYEELQEITEALVLKVR